MRTRMIDRHDFGYGTAALLLSWASAHAIGFYLSLPGWAQKLSQLAFTLFCGLVYWTVQHFYRQFLNHFFPDPKPPGPSASED